MIRLAVALCLVGGMAAVSARAADKPLPPAAPGEPQPKLAPPAPRQPGLPPGVAAPSKTVPGVAAALPSTPQERAKLLDNLYAYLATAEDAEHAAPITGAIEKLWLFADSDTIGVLMDRSAKAVAEKNNGLALQFLDAVVELAPDYAEGWNRRAYVHYLDNDIERMLGDLRRCLALEPNHYRALDGLAQVLRDRGQKKGALKAYQRLLEIHPTAPGTKDAIEELSRDVDGQKT